MDHSRQIVELLDDCIQELSLDGTVVTANASARSLLSASSLSEIAGSVWRDLLPLPIRGLAEAAINSARDGISSAFEAKISPLGDDLKTWRFKVSPLIEGSRVSGLLAVATDITARIAAYTAADVLHDAFRTKAEEARVKLAAAAQREADLLDHVRLSESQLLATNLAYQQLEVKHYEVSQERVLAMAAQEAAETIAEQAQKGEAVGQLLAGVVHDLNNFLNSATTAIDLVMISGELSPKNTRLLNVADSALQQGAEMSQRLVGFARKHPYRPESVDLVELIEAMDPLLKQAVGTKARLELDTCQSGCCAMVDRNTLERALLNLVINARDACKQGDSIRVKTGSLHVSPDESSPSKVAGDYVTLTVEDTGAGMSPEVVARVFEVYFTTKPVGEGSGLGLPQVHSAVRQAGGFVTVSSTVGQGACFELALPKVGSVRDSR